MFLKHFRVNHSIYNVQNPLSIVSNHNLNISIADENAIEYHVRLALNTSNDLKSIQNQISIYHAYLLIHLSAINKLHQQK